MTAILGIDLAGSIGPVLAADSFCGAGYNRRPEKRKIVPLAGDSAVAVSGAGRSLHLVEGNRKELAEVREDPAMFVRKLRQILHDDGYQRDANETIWTHMDSAFMLANSEGMWVIDASMVPARLPIRHPFGIGCGGEYAMGAMHICLEVVGSMREDSELGMIRTALLRSLEAAERFSFGCGGKLEMWLPNASSSEGEFVTLRS